MERTNKEIARHLRALVNDERLRMSWSDPQNLALIQYALNERVNTETGRYFRVSDACDPERTANEWLQSLNKSLAAIRDVTQ